MSESPQWKHVKVPKMLYLPTMGGLDFKDTGIRVEMDDDLELLPGSNRIRINGAEHQMIISCDKLRIDDKGFIQLDKPQRPRPLSAGGDGRAYVGRTGIAASRANQDRPHIDTAARFQEDGQGNYVRQVAFRTYDPAGFDTAIQKHFGKPDPKFAKKADAMAAKAFHEIPKGTEWRNITLKNGQSARVLVDIHTGVHVSAPMRTYNGGGNPGEYQALMAAEGGPSPTISEWGGSSPPPQVRSARRPEPPRTGGNPSGYSGYTPTPGPATHRESNLVPTGVAHLDNFIGGYPRGHVTHIFGEHTSREAISHASGGSVCTSIESAFGRMALLKPSQSPIVVITLPDALDDTLRLSLAEELPVLAEQIKSRNIAVIISTPDWGDGMPALLKYSPSTRLHITPNDRDERFVTATIVKSHTGATGNESSTFPRP